MTYVQASLRFVPKRRGGHNLCYEGHKFSIKSRRDNKVHWRCCKPTCSATINTSSGVITTYRDIHNHVPEHSHIVNVNDMTIADCRPIPSIYQEEIIMKNSNDKEEGTPDDDDDPRSSHKTMKQIKVKDHENALNSECASLNTVTYQPLVGIKSVKMETIDSIESKILPRNGLESNKHRVESTTGTPLRDIPKYRGKENNQSKAGDTSDDNNESAPSDNINFPSLYGNELMKQRWQIGPNPPLYDLESNRNAAGNINVKKDRALCNDIFKSNGEENTQVDDEMLISLDNESESSNSSDPSPLYGIELVKKEIEVCLGSALTRPKSNIDPLDDKNRKSVCGDENLKNDSKTCDFKSVDISQYSVKCKSESSNSIAGNCVTHIDSQFFSNSLTKHPGAKQAVSPLYSDSESASNCDHTEITEPFSGIIDDPVRTSISKTQSLRNVLDKRMDDANRDSGSRRNKRKGDTSKLPPEKRNCSSLDRLTRMCEQDDPTSNKNCTTDEKMFHDVPPKYLRDETKEIDITQPKKVPETQHNPRFVMGNERPPPEYPHYLDQTNNISHNHGNMHSGSSFRRHHFRFNDGHGHIPYMIPDQVLPPAFHMPNRYNHSNSIPHPQHFPFMHGCNTDRPVTDQDYLRQVMRHEEIYHASKMSLIESDKACGEAEHAAKIKLITAELEVVELQRLYWKRRLAHIPDKDSDSHEDS